MSGIDEVLTEFQVNIPGVSEVDSIKHETYRKRGIRWIALALLSLMTLGRYYCFDNPAALAPQLKSIIGLNNLEYNALYTVYSLPNIIIALIAGILIDNYGARKGIFVSLFLITIGQLFFALGCYLSSYYLLLIGRIIFGLGGDSLLIAKIKTITIWFNHDEVAFAFSCTLAISRVGNTLNSFLTPMFYNISNSLFFPSFIGFLITFASLLCGIGIILLDLKAEKVDSLDLNLSKTLISHNNEDEIGQSKDNLNESILEQAYNNISFRDIKYFSALSWIILIIFALSISTANGFIGVIIDLMQKRFSFSNSQAGSLLGIAFFISVIFSPIGGNIIDKFGQRLKLLLFSSLCWGACLSMYIFMPSFTSYNLFYIPITLFGIFLTIFPTTAFTCLCLTVKHEVLGLLIGLTGAITNLTTAIITLIYGWIADYTIDIDEGYFWSSGFYLVLVIVSIINGIASFYFDLKYQTKLNYVRV